MKIKLIKHILSGFHSVSSTDKWIEKEIEVPVCPTVGWYVMGEKIKCITLEEEGLEFYVEPDSKFYDRASLGKYTPDHAATPEEMADLVNSYIAIGWTKKEKTK